MRERSRIEAQAEKCPDLEPSVVWRRRVAPAFLLLAILLAKGCGSSDDAVTVTLWHQMRPGDRAVLQDRLRAFELENPGVRIRELYKETEELRSGLESAVLVGRGPDVVYGPSDPVGVYDEIGALRDLSKWFDDQDRAEFDKRALVFGRGARPEQSESKNNPDDAKTRLLLVGDRFGNHLALVYNRLLVDRPPETTDELVRLAKKATVDTNGDGRPDQYGLVWNYSEPFFVIPFLKGYGAWIFAEPEAVGLRPTPDLNTPAAVEAYRFVYALRDEHGVLPESADYENAAGRFRAGKAGMLIDGDWSWQGYLRESARQKEAGQPVLDAAVAPLPVCSATGETMGGMVAPKGYSLSVAAKGERLGPAVSLIRFLTDESTQRAYLERQRIYPSRLSLRDEPLLREDPTLRASIEQIDASWVMPTATEMRAVWDAMRPPYEELMAGKKDAAVAAEEMQRDALARIDTLTGSVAPDATVSLVYLGGFAALIAIAAAMRRWWLTLRIDFPKNRLAYALAAPAMAMIFLIVVFPLAYNVLLSFSNMSLQDFSDWRIVGLHNYREVFLGDKADEFWGVFFKTIFWTVVNVACHVSIGVLLAVVLNGPVRGKSFYRLLLIIPWAVPAYITALTWRGMFDMEFGAVNQFLRGVNAWLPSWLRVAGNQLAGHRGRARVRRLHRRQCLARVSLHDGHRPGRSTGHPPGSLRGGAHRPRHAMAAVLEHYRSYAQARVAPGDRARFCLDVQQSERRLARFQRRRAGGSDAHLVVSYVYRSVFNLYQYGYGAALSMVIFGMLLAFSAVFLRQTKAAEGV